MKDISAKEEDMDEQFLAWINSVEEELEHKESLFNEDDILDMMGMIFRIIL